MACEFRFYGRLFAQERLGGWVGASPRACEDVLDAFLHCQLLEEKPQPVGCYANQFAAFGRYGRDDIFRLIRSGHFARPTCSVIADCPCRLEERGLAGVVLTHRLADQVLETVGGVIALPERISIRVVDNALCYDTTKRIARALSARQIDQCSVKIQRGVAHLGVTRVAPEYVERCN